MTTATGAIDWGQSRSSQPPLKSGVLLLREARSARLELDVLRNDPDPGPETPEIVRMIVEIPRDSSNKYEFDWNLKLFKLARTLYSPLHYPGDYGFIPGTIAEDNEPLDIICLVTSPSFTGCLTYVRRWPCSRWWTENT